MHGGIILIGMPAAGKSTIGAALAGKLGWEFIDTDELLRKRHGNSLEGLLRTEGYAGLRHLEEQLVLDIEPAGKIVATGGSAVYSTVAMRHLQKGCRIYYLAPPLETIAARIGDLNARGVARPPGQSLAEVYAERTPLYESWANIVIPGDMHPEQTLGIIAAYERGSSLRQKQ